MLKEPAFWLARQSARPDQFFDNRNHCRRVVANLKTDMMFSLDELLERINAVGEKPSLRDDMRSLLHAYIACLSLSELCNAIATGLGAPANVRMALRSRLLRLLHEGQTGSDAAILVELIEQTILASDADKKSRQAADGVHSAVFAYLPLPAQHTLLDRWADRGSRGTMARWLKATKEHPRLFDAEVAFVYWRWSKDSRAAKSLAYQAPPETLAQIIPELVDVCDEGWIIARAILRVEVVDESCWEVIKAKHPATYLYLSAQTRRPVNDDEAFDLVSRCPGSTLGGDRGLAIWAVGQMGKVAVLDQVRAASATLDERERAELVEYHTAIEPMQTPAAR